MNKKCPICGSNCWRDEHPDGFLIGLWHCSDCAWIEKSSIDSLICNSCIYNGIGDEKVNQYRQNEKDLILKIKGWAYAFKKNNKDVDIERLISVIEDYLKIYDKEI